MTLTAFLFRQIFRFIGWLERRKKEKLISEFSAGKTRLSKYTGIFDLYRYEDVVALLKTLSILNRPHVIKNSHIAYKPNGIGRYQDLSLYEKEGGRVEMLQEGDRRFETLTEFSPYYQAGTYRALITGAFVVIENSEIRIDEEVKGYLSDFVEFLKVKGMVAEFRHIVMSMCCRDCGLVCESLVVAD